MKFAALLFLVACGSKPDDAPAPPPPPPIDAPIDGITEIGTYDPASGAHLDDDGSGAAPHVNGSKRPGRPIEITLRSTPPKATAFVDGVSLGPTPGFWMGEANGREHTFTFTLRGHDTVVYRFVPVASGVVHARLEATSGAEDAAPIDAGVPVTKLAPPPPPTTVVTAKPDAPIAPIDAPPPPIVVDAPLD